MSVDTDFHIKLAKNIKFKCTRSAQCELESIFRRNTRRHCHFNCGLCYEYINSRFVFKVINLEMKYFRPFFIKVFCQNSKIRKHKYKIDTNKELFALGMANLVGSFFKCFTAGGTLARSVVQEESGGKTQVVQVYS